MSSIKNCFINYRWPIHVDALHVYRPSSILTMEKVDCDVTGVLFSHKAEVCIR